MMDISWSLNLETAHSNKIYMNFVNLSIAYPLSLEVSKLHSSPINKRFFEEFIISSNKRNPSVILSNTVLTFF